MWIAIYVFKMFWDRQFYHIILPISSIANAIYAVKSSRGKKIKLVMYTEPVPLTQLLT